MCAKAPGADSKRHLPEALPEAFGSVRVGPLLSIPSILEEHGLDPSRVLAQVGLDARLFDNPENRVSFAALGRLLETCVELTRCRHFGLLIGQRFKLDSLGVLGELMSNCPTVRDALRLAALYLDLHDRGAVSLTLDLGEGKSALGYSLFEVKSPAAEQILDGAIAMQYLLLRDLCGPAWRPVLVQLSHSRPTNIGPLQKHFRADLEFDVHISGIVFESHWLDHRIEGADPAALAAITKAIESGRPQQAMPFLAQVRRALHAMMFTGSVSSANLARLFDLNERTLRRRLAEEGVTVRGLTNEARRELAHRLLRDTDLPVSEVAAVLRYSDVTVFARAFRGWSNMSPREWRGQYRSAR
jgi:AraC-like DNA-binding protein